MLEATSRGFRFLVLFFNCMLTFGSYFCFDMPSVLQKMFQAPDCKDEPNNSTITEDFLSPQHHGSHALMWMTSDAEVTSHNGSHGGGNTTCCKGCLGMSPDDYNLLYAIYAWTDAVIVIAAGFLIDKLGNRIGLMAFSFLATSGSVLFALGAMFPGTKAILPLMLIGRLIFGAGNGSLTVVQNRVTAFWFKNKELALAFGVTLAFSRLGSVLNFFLTQSFADHFGLQMTLWGGTLLCGLGFISAIVVSGMDRYGVKQLGVGETLKEESKNLKFTDVRHFSLQYWLLTLTLMFFYNGVFPFVADASKFIQDKYGYKPQTASYISGAAYDVSMVISPFLGGLIDIGGKRGVLALCCGLFTLPVYGILAFTELPPLIATIWLGFTYSFAAASMWPSIPLVVKQATVGTAMGITTSVQMVGIGLCNLVVGSILGTEKEDHSQDAEKLRRWKYVMVFLLFNVIGCALCALVLNIVDAKRGGILNESRKQRIARQAREKTEEESRDDVIEDPDENPDEERTQDTDELLPKFENPSVN